MNLLHGETILRESSGKTLVLTTHRIRYQVENIGSAQVKSIMLEELASYALLKTSQPVFIVLAALSALLGLALAGGNGSGGILIVSLVVAGFFVLLYVSSQQQILAFASAGTTIRISTKGMKFDAAKEFIDHAEAAKNSRYFARS